LKELNLNGNFLHDDGAEQIAKAINTNTKNVLKKLECGWNGIGDIGITALANAIEESSKSNHISLRVLGLAVSFCFFNNLNFAISHHHSNIWQ